jgi:hypothetical protein
MREKELLKLEKRVDKQKEKLVSRERALVEAEEKHRGPPPPIIPYTPPRLKTILTRNTVQWRPYQRPCR